MNPPRRTEDSPNWGGKRDKAGRPPISGERRVSVGINMLPADRGWLDSLAKERGVSRSEIFASIVADYKLILRFPKVKAQVESLRGME